MAGCETGGMEFHLSFHEARGTMAKKIRLLSLIVIIVSGVLKMSLTFSAVTKHGGRQPANISCARPMAEAVQRCRQLEQQILSATVRIELESWSVAADESGYIRHHANGHATIKEGRYLITHNHYNIPLSTPLAPGKQASYTKVSIHKADGQLLFSTSLSNFRVDLVEAQTLVIDIGESGAQQLAAAGLHSAGFRSWSSLSLRPGMEVAQVDWDGEIAHVDWVKIAALVTNDGTPRVELNNYIQIGASGGAVFWNGYHIANNWARVAEHDAGDYERTYSIGALNSWLVATAPGSSAHS
jgi:hypothetical protein